MTSATFTPAGKKITKAFITGAIPAFLEGLLIHFADPQAGNWLLLQSVLFWFSCGFVVFMATPDKKKVLVSVSLTLLLNIPWYIALTVIAHKPEHLLPLIISSLVMGLIIGFVGSSLSKRS